MTHLTSDQIREILANTDPEASYPPEAASVFLGGVAESTLARWRCEGGGPEYTRLSRNLLVYKRKHLLEFQESKRRSSTSQEPEFVTSTSRGEASS